MVAVVGLSPMLVYFIADVVGWVLRRKPGCNQKTALEPGTSKDESPLCLPGEVDRVAIGGDAHNGMTPEQAIDKASKRAEAIFAKYPIAQS